MEQPPCLPRLFSARTTQCRHGFCKNRVRGWMLTRTERPILRIGPMSMNTVWSCIETLAAALDGNRAAAEQSLGEFERAMRQLERGRRDEVRRLMILIVAGLSR